jgi:N-acetylglucosaminyldiphosphoundecaprenol N-acetyl-beta-D-mannosaminyltransferase
VLEARHTKRRINLLGGDVDLVTRDGVIEVLHHFVDRNHKAIVANQNLHSLYLSRRDPSMAKFYAMADLIEIDSMPLVYWARLLGFPASQRNRCTYLDWRDQFWQAASAGRWRVFLLGGADGVAPRAADRLGREWAGVTFATHHGYFDHSTGSAGTLAVLDEINAFQPDILLVGMGMPIQETWIARNFTTLQQGVVLSVGAAFDYEAGLQKAAPRFLGAVCLEWLYRLAHQPRRLARRYLVEPWSLMGAAFADVRRYSRRHERRVAGRRSIRPWGPPLSHEEELSPKRPDLKEAA